MLRKSSNHDKQLWLNQLRRLSCQSPDACEFQSLCIGAYQEHLDGVALIARARASVAGAHTSDPDASTDTLTNTLASVDAAERKLKSAKLRMQSCAENEAVIRQRYRL